ncbi:putative bifunctional dTTP/UTP pyrophosphatase/methyltransferase protein [Saccoglossus kowalevskii]|uniref:N-acetylserotonin O-methyltransferase-like protein-like n=1 Tax=Saccoglossus kowalevskii TaxID=10224 RepID=A0ABM0GQK1_SACKO|nr:PREDICTED: N-acetylserotonin O-methyltransferase-like protein-like [Saccoglossus kowalevskii]
MLQPILHKLHNQRIVLASGSPRRQEILRNIGLKFEVITSKFEENFDKSLFSSPVDYVNETAKEKTLEVANRLQGPGCPDIIIGADTVVSLGEKILEKPQDKNDAFTMLSSLSGKSHTVYTGMVILTKTDKQSKHPFDILQFHEATDVVFGELTPEIIHGYIETGEPMDKAGGYGIQALGGTLVQEIRGDYYNVVGFPLHHFCKQFLKLYAK